MARAEVRPERWCEDVQDNATESSSLPSVARYCRGDAGNVGLLPPCKNYSQMRTFSRKLIFQFNQNRRLLVITGNVGFSVGPIINNRTSSASTRITRSLKMASSLRKSDTPRLELISRPYTTAEAVIRVRVLNIIVLVVGATNGLSHGGIIRTSKILPIQGHSWKLQCNSTITGENTTNRVRKPLFLSLEEAYTIIIELARQQDVILLTGVKDVWFLVAFSR